MTNFIIAVTVIIAVSVKLLKFYSQPYKKDKQHNGSSVLVTVVMATEETLVVRNTYKTQEQDACRGYGNIYDVFGGKTKQQIHCLCVYMSTTGGKSYNVSFTTKICPDYLLDNSIHVQQISTAELKSWREKQIMHQRPVISRSCFESYSSCELLNLF